MRERFDEWLFTGTTISAVLLSIGTTNPEHPLAVSARTLGYALACLCIIATALAFWVRGRRSRARH